MPGNHTAPDKVDGSLTCIDKAPIEPALCASRKTGQYQKNRQSLDSDIGLPGSGQDSWSRLSPVEMGDGFHEGAPIR
jgi:hypothetical protein